MNNPNNPNNGAPGLNLTPGDIYYIVFKHKWKIVLMGLLGIAAAGALYVTLPRSYQSRAKLFIRYIEEAQATVSIDEVDRVTRPDSRGDTIINSEIQILTSFDLAQEVADRIGPANLIGSKATEFDPRIMAAVAVQEGLAVEVPSKSTVISLSFISQNAEIVQATLKQIIESYFAKHLEIHRSTGTFDDFLTQQTDQMKARLSLTEEELRKELNSAGVISIEGSKAANSQQVQNLREQIFAAEAELASRQAWLDQAKKQMGTPSASDTDPQPVLSIEPEVQEQYARLQNRIELLRIREQELMLQFTGENILLKGTREQIKASEDTKTQLEASHPMLGTIATIALSGGAPGQPSQDLQSLASEVLALEARITVLNQQLTLIREESTRIDSVEIAIKELERRRSLEETNYEYFARNLEKSRIDEALGGGKVNNISIVQQPSPPLKAESKRIPIIAGAAASGFILALAWAFAVELFLDRTVKRPIDIERKFGIPLFLSIPNAKQRSFRKLARSKDKEHLRLVAAAKARKPKDKHAYHPSSPTLIAAAKSKPNEFGETASMPADSMALTAYDETSELKPYYEALRDRMIGFFESRNLTHSPKLIGLTGLGKSPGVTTIASGLATCLSETGEGNVLLVDMTLGQESAQQFYQGKEICDLDQVLESQQKALHKDNLYVVAEGTNGYKVPTILPNRFNHIIPKLKASDFDYIIFDMPEVSPISPTPRLAGFMDAMLMVIESEKTNTDVVEKATELLRDSNKHVGAILNKTNNYVPRVLQNDFVGHS